MSQLLTPFRVEIGVWVAVFIGLLFGIGVETNWGQQFEYALPSDATQSAFTTPDLTTPYRLPAQDTLMETSIRPVFVPTRRPAPTPPPTQPPKPHMKRDQFVLTGTTMTAEGKFAHLIEKASNKSHVVTEGKEVNGILVKTVLPEQAVLSQYDDIETLILRAPVTTPGGQPKR